MSEMDNAFSLAVYKLQLCKKSFWIVTSQKKWLQLMSQMLAPQ